LNRRTKRGGKSGFGSSFFQDERSSVRDSSVYISLFRCIRLANHKIIIYIIIISRDHKSYFMYSMRKGSKSISRYCSAVSGEQCSAPRSRLEIRFVCGQYTLQHRWNGCSLEVLTKLYRNRRIHDNITGNKIIIFRNNRVGIISIVKTFYCQIQTIILL